MEFQVHTLPEFDNLFPKLVSMTKFEDITKGRRGAVLVSCLDSCLDTSNIVRTTTVYRNPPQKFSEIHYDLVDKIKKICNATLQFNNALPILFNNALPILFNNALIELYDNNYCSMGYHSDQALDLEDDSCICIFSCYEKPIGATRTLVIKKKICENSEETQIEMSHNSVILFSTDTNRKHLHKIILENTSENNRWIGITFRLSKTYVRFVDDSVYFKSDEHQLTLATPEEKKLYYKCRSDENKNIEYKYPEIYYTISPSDLMRPV
jgi:hypothetical protein